MKESSPSILIISSASPVKYAGRIVLDYYKAFKEKEYDVDLLTLYAVDDYPEILWVYKNELSKFSTFISRIKGRLLFPNNTGYLAFNKSDKKRPIPIDLLLRKTQKKYDLILIFFWNGMLSFSTVQALYDKFKCQIHFMGVDFYQMTGGCSFTNNCSRFENGCGYCPAALSVRKKDFSYKNVIFRKMVYDRCKPVVWGNRYMADRFYKRSCLLKNARIEIGCDIFNLNEIFPREKESLRGKYEIPNEKKFLLLFGCHSLRDKRKGIEYLIRSINLFYDSLLPEERSSVLLMVVGNDYEKVKDKLRFDSLGFGYVEMDTLIDLYSLVDVYLSPSINDAGPTMVGQSLCCGTPVVAFQMGSALEYIKYKDTGYCAKLKDNNDFANGIKLIFKLSKEERLKMRENCRQYAINNFSYDKTVKRIIDTYNKYK